MHLSFLWSARVSDVFVFRQPLLFFFRFQGLAHAVEDAVRFLIVAALDITPVLVVVVFVVNAILLADNKYLFPHAPALTSTAALAFVALFLS